MSTNVLRKGRRGRGKQNYYGIKTAPKKTFNWQVTVPMNSLGSASIQTLQLDLACAGLLPTDSATLFVTAGKLPAQNTLTGWSIPSDGTLRVLISVVIQPNPGQNGHLRVSVRR